MSRGFTIFLIGNSTGIFPGQIYPGRNIALAYTHLASRFAEAEVSDLACLRCKVGSNAVPGFIPERPEITRLESVSRQPGAIVLTTGPRLFTVRAINLVVKALLVLGLDESDGTIFRSGLG